MLYTELSSVASFHLEEKRTSTPKSAPEIKEIYNDGVLNEKNAAGLQDLSTIRSKEYLSFQY